MTLLERQKDVERQAQLNLRRQFVQPHSFNGDSSYGRASIAIPLSNRKNPQYYCLVKKRSSSSV
jgi:hypothetical protein